MEATMENQITENEFEDLLFNWDEGVEKFYRFAEVCCGMEDWQMSVIKEVVKNEDYLNRFIDKFDGDWNLMNTIWPMFDERVQYVS